MIKQTSTQTAARLAVIALVASGLFVQTANLACFAGGYHPRRAETMGRDRNLARQMNQDYGHLGGHYNQLQRQDQRIRQQEQHDFRTNGGYLTGTQQRQINGEENNLRNRMQQDYAQGRPGDQFADNHPRRAEVLGRDSRINGRLNRDYGQLDGNYGQLKQQDQSIRQQEQADAKANGGYITQQQRQQFNQEESQLNQQIKQDMQQ